ncbi:MAG: hypothetical protein AAFR61_25830 [Bacteroidota bacterium]
MKSETREGMLGVHHPQDFLPTVAAYLPRTIIFGEGVGNLEALYALELVRTYYPQIACYWYKPGLCVEKRASWLMAGGEGFMPAEMSSWSDFLHGKESKVVLNSLSPQEERVMQQILNNITELAKVKGFLDQMQSVDDEAAQSMQEEIEATIAYHKKLKAQLDSTKKKK